MFNITCTVHELDAMDPKYAYTWTRDGGNSITENGSTLSFSSLNFSDAGKYTCEATVSSDISFGGNVTGMNSYNLSIKRKQINHCSAHIIVCRHFFLI